jgi:2-oxoisovalerate dehydrogenase E1 component alpha subunit
VEANVSRLYGHSSASGANFVTEEADCITQYEEKLAEHGLLTKKDAEALRKQSVEELADLARQVRDEPQPDPSTIWNNIYKESP